VYTAKEVITSNKDNQVVHESKIFALKQVTHLSAKVCVISVCVMCACVHVCIVFMCALCACVHACVRVCVCVSAQSALCIL
jgi:hypothetical protein